MWSYARAEAAASPPVERLFDEVAVQAALRWRALAAIDVANLAWAFAKVYAALDFGAPRQPSSVDSIPPMRCPDE